MRARALDLMPLLRCLRRLAFALLLMLAWIPGSAAPPGNDKAFDNAVIPAQAGIQYGPALAPASPGNDEMSTLYPRGPQAEQLAQLSWVLYIGGALIFAGVMLLAAYAFWGARRGLLARRSLIVGGGIIFPVVTLSFLMVYAFAYAPYTEAGGPPAVRIEVTGEQFWWRVRYLDEHGVARFETANEIHIPVGRSVELQLRAGDVIHSFWVPNLAGKLDMIPGRTNTLRVQARRAGVYRGQCSEYCGAQHAKMAFHVVAQTPEDFERWLAHEASEVAVAADTRAAHSLFMASCAGCHSIRGTEARGAIGPDLTHVGGRAYLGAGIVLRTPGAMAGWIADAQALKPGNRMPAFHDLDADALHALTAYMEQLH
jgi:cytochrome c oxidase subunit II